MYNAPMSKEEQTTQQAYLATKLLDTPIWAIYNMLLFILYKDLGATPIQLAFVVALKPIVSFFSMYWSALVNGRPDRLVANIVFARLIGCSLFFAVPFVDSPWFFILASGVFMMMAVGAVPAWMEILRQNLDSTKRKETFAYGSAVGYLGGGLLPLVFSWFLDSQMQAWRWIFPLAALFSLLAILVQLRLKIPEHISTPDTNKLSVHQPWINIWQLLKKRFDFLQYQMGFMVMGGALMLLQPALPVFFVDSLGLSYMELATALALCKGISFAIASPLWARWLNHVDIFRFTGWVTLCACLFPCLLFFAKWDLAWLYAAYLCYGAMQAGSELSWNMSGPIFARDEDSSLYTTANVASVGVRGCFAPALGSILCAMTGAPVVMAVGVALFALSAAMMFHYSKSYRPSTISNY